MLKQLAQSMLVQILLRRRCCLKKNKDFIEHRFNGSNGFTRINIIIRGDPSNPLDPCSILVFVLAYPGWVLTCPDSVSHWECKKKNDMSSKKLSKMFFVLFVSV